MAGHLDLTYRQYLALEAGELEIDNERTSGSSTCAGGLQGQWRRERVRPDRERLLTVRLLGPLLVHD
jgi:hypothetical protein